jgi:hypothetical protein
MPGVQIAMSHFNQTSFNRKTGTAKVGPGQRSEEVYQALEPFNVIIGDSSLLVMFLASASADSL